MNTMTQSEKTVTRRLRDDGIMVLTLDMPGKSANILTPQVFDDLDFHFDAIGKRVANDVRGLILRSAKPKFFVAGADLHQIADSLDWPDEQIHQFCLNGQRTMARLGQFPFPTVAAVHGICVGGGLELALSCDFRVCSSARDTLLGLPEVKLGLIPGWRGTARAPRLIGLEEALELVTTGRLLTADEADGYLLIDEWVEGDRLIDACVDFLLECDERRMLERRKLMDSPLISGQIKDNPLDQWKERIAANKKIHPFAPEVVAEHMIRSASMHLDEAGVSEAHAMARVWGSDSNRGLLNMFFVEERIKKCPGDVPDASAKKITRLGIVGAGQMGTQLAEAFVRANKHVVIYDANREAAERLAGQLYGKSRNIQFAEDLQGLGECDCVIESIVENARIKRDVLGRLESHLADDAVIASATSAIPISDIAAGLQNPQRFVGLHWCHPVKLRTICEVVPSRHTDGPTLVTALALAKLTRKMPLIVADHPGFAVNRLLAPMLDQAVSLFAAGVPAEQIERVATDFGFASGPLKFVDSIGVDTLFYAGTVLAERVPDLLGRSKVFTHLIKAGRLGQKSGAGFFKYPPESPETAVVDPELETALSLVLQEARTEIQLSDHDVQMNLLIPMVVEANQLLTQGVVRDARDIDFASVHGCSFPAHRGGLMFWADSLGAATIVESIERVAESRPGLRVPDSIRQMAESGGKFHHK